MRSGQLGDAETIQDGEARTGHLDLCKPRVVVLEVCTMFQYTGGSEVGRVNRKSFIVVVTEVPDVFRDAIDHFVGACALATA